MHRGFLVALLGIGLLACSSNETGASGSGGSGGGSGGEGGSGGGGGSGSGGGSGGGGSGGGGSGGACDPAAGTYFVENTGNDDGPGTSAEPFRHIAVALEAAQPGDTVVVRQGTYDERITFPRSGAPGAPITVRAACGARPILDGTNLIGTGEVGMFNIFDQAHIVVEGFEIRNLAGVDGNFPAGIWVRGAAHDIVIRDNVIHDILAENGGDGTGAHGIAVYGTETTPAERISVIGNELHDLVLGWSEALVINGNVRDFEVRDNHVHHVNNIAFDFIGFEGDVCGSCSQDDEIDAPDVNRVRKGLIVGNLAHDVTSAGNPAYGNEKAAGCFYVDGGADLVIERNTAHDCDLGVELASEWFGKSTRAIVVRNNFLHDNDVTCIATGGYSSGNGGGGGAAKNNVIVNNTLFNCSRDGWADAAILLQNRNEGNVYQNNIVVATMGTSAVVIAGSGNTGNVFDFNIYFNGGLDGASGGANSLTVDPKLVNPLNGDLHLSPGSPAKDEGSGAVDVGAVDIDGENRKNGPVDIGADEL
ncbi:DUF1565 domain-containing protein [Polyangium sp. 15x6]|uniref:DUF1565 domain-containing protein n=1 Tax=Polyangium sp. 15x6 TaxID=3042687 RepID=UPI00249CDAA4|nr:DUF1565 domain-containing protein [Polyangium sp. 15x6]MDI3285234.1 DUF1565 domain-containing protein [Polyangium sp. 15x6]